MTFFFGFLKTKNEGYAGWGGAAKKGWSVFVTTRFVSFPVINNHNPHSRILLLWGEGWGFLFLLSAVTPNDQMPERPFDSIQEFEKLILLSTIAKLTLK